MLMGKVSKTRPHFLPSGRLKKTAEKLDYRDVIEKASRSMIRFKKPEHLIRMIVRIIAEQVGVSHTGVLLHKKQKDSYVLIDSKGEEGRKIPIGYIRIPANNALINIFSEKKTPLLDERGVLTYATLPALLKNQALLNKEITLKHKITKIKEEMDLLGADICIPAFFKKRLLGILILGNKLDHTKFDNEEIGFFATLANDVAMAITNAQLIEDLQEKVKEVALLYEREHRLFIHTSIALAAAIDARDPYTHGHTERVTYYSLMIADEMGNTPEIQSYKNFRETLHIGALLHDIGKIGIPDNILNKKRQLNPKEYNKVKDHPQIGATILQPIKELKEIIDIVKTHQERYDGKGYPDGLKGDQIPFTARNVSVADAFDAITTNRPYRKKKNLTEAVKDIEKHSGTQFDPLVVTAFLKAYRKGKIFQIPPAKY